jgi:VanZ family protein
MARLTRKNRLDARQTMSENRLRRLAACIELDSNKDLHQGPETKWHVAEFAILCSFSLARSNRVSRSTPRRNLIISVILCIIFALADEYHLTFIPDRGGTWTDVGIDCYGGNACSMLDGPLAIEATGRAGAGSTR